MHLTSSNRSLNIVVPTNGLFDEVTYVLVGDVACMLEAQDATATCTIIQYSMMQTIVCLDGIKE